MDRQSAAQLQNEFLRIAFVRLDEAAGGGIGYDLLLSAADGWHRVYDAPFAQCWLVLRTEQAAPVTLDPAWQPGREETNFAQFHTAQGTGADVFQAGAMSHITLDRVEQLDATTVRCGTADGRLDVTWRLPAEDSRVTITFAYTPDCEGWYSVGFQAFAGLAPEDVRAIAAGPVVCERRFPVCAGVLPETHLMLPAAVLETSVAGQAVTWALGSDPALGGANWRNLADARYALGALNEAGLIQLQLFAPVLGCADSWLRAGETCRFTLLLQAQNGGWWDAYRALAREVYGLRSYRRNWLGSLTDAFHNLLDLLKDDRFSGWYERGKGLANIEHDQGVKLASPGAALSAGLVSGDEELLRTRALPILEYSISRSHYGFTWEFGSAGWVDQYVRQAVEDLGGPAWDAPVLVALHELARGYTPALGLLARQHGAGVRDFYIRREEFQVSLSRYRLTGERRYLEQACAEADAYIAARVALPATAPIEGQRFSIHIGPDWISLLDLYEETREQRYLDAATAGARWFATLLSTEPPPPPDATARTVPAGAGFTGSGKADTNWATAAVQYPRRETIVPSETVPAWLVSPNGMGFEAWSTHYSGRRRIQNPAWAADLLRLARYTGDDLYRDLAENGITGRFTNYPGYYMNGPVAAQLRPDFPYLGPSGLSSIYFHHILPQLGLTLDYLVEQVRYLSAGQITFPAVRDDSYVHFRHQLYGHAPGRFFGHEGVWLWLPRGIISLDTVLLNWIAAEAGDRFFVALVNTASEPVTATVRFDGARLGLDEQRVYQVEVHQGVTTEYRQARAGALKVTAPPHGLTALVLHGTQIVEPLHRYGPAHQAHASDAFVTLAEDDPNLGAVRAAIVATGPAEARAYVFSTVTPEYIARALLHYQQGGEWVELCCDRYPFEFSVPLTNQTMPFQFRFSVVDRHGRRYASDVGALGYTAHEEGLSEFR
jgi:hypothetical protein